MSHPFLSTVTYTATRNVISGHVLGSEYSIEFSCSVKDYAVDEDSDTIEPYGNGMPVTALFSLKDVWRLEAYGILEADLPLWKEFITSVIGSEPFTFDAKGSIASPDNPITAVLVSQGFKPRRIDPVETYSIPFSVRTF